MIWHDWGAPVLVLVVGLVVGISMALQAKGSIRPEVNQRLRALLSDRKESLILKLLEHESLREGMTPEAFERAVGPLRTEAANCLRDLEVLGQPLPGTELRREHQRRTRLGWTLGSLGLLAGSIGLMMYMVVGEATDRDRPVGEQIAEAQDILESNPSDLDANNLLNYWQLNQLVVPHLRGVLTLESLVQFGTQQGLWQRLEKVDQIDASSVDHRLNQAILASLYAAAADPTLIVQAGERFSSIDGSKVDASVLGLWRAFYRLAQGDRVLATQTLESVSVESLNELESNVFNLLRSKLAVEIRARVRVVEGGLPVSRSEGLLYISIRDSEAGSGMPHAVKRVSGAFLGAQVELDELDVPPMRADAPWPDPFWIHAYYDADGVVERGKSQEDPRNIFAEALGPFSLGDELSTQELVLSTPAQAALIELPGVEQLVAAEVPWLEWDFDPFPSGEAQHTMTSEGMVEAALSEGRLAEAVGWMSRAQRTEDTTVQTWLYGALLQHLGGETSLAAQRLGFMLEKFEQPNLWLWSAWMAADRGDEAGWADALERASDAGAQETLPEFYAQIASLEVRQAMLLEAQVRWGPDGPPEGTSGTVWVVVRGEVDETGKRSVIASSRLALDELPMSTSDWQMMAVWPRAVWVEAYVAEGPGRLDGQVASPLRGPLRRGSTIELVMEVAPPGPPPGHP